MTKAYFLLVFIVIHTGLRVRNRGLLSTPSTGTLSKSTYYKRVVPIMHAIAKHIDQIRPENRYKTNDHILHFPKWVTGIELNSYPTIEILVKISEPINCHPRY